MVSSVKQLSWKPIWVGHIYCSPACGRGCTRREYDKAVADGQALAEKLGAGWKSRVWENSGWHSSAVKYQAEVHPEGDGTFTCYLNINPQFVVTSARTPEAAVMRALVEARDFVRELEKRLAIWEKPLLQRIVPSRS